MPTTDTPTTIVNSAILLMGGDQAPITGVAPNFDNSIAGKAAANLYGPCVATVGREFGWDFARNIVALTATGNTVPLPWTFEYLYPGNGVQVWQLLPATLVDPNNPLPINWTIGNTLVSSVQTKVIWTNQASAQAAYNNNPLPSTWDPGFREAVVRLLASEMAMAIAGKPDSSENLLQSGASFETIAEGRDS